MLVSVVNHRTMKEKSVQGSLEDFMLVLGIEPIIALRAFQSFFAVEDVCRRLPRAMKSPLAQNILREDVYVRQIF